MAKHTPELLALCLEAVQSGRLTLAECLAAHPDEADELRPLLEVALGIPPFPDVTPDPAFRLRGRVAVVEAITLENRGVTNGWLPRLNGGFWIRSTFTRRREMPAFIAAVILLLTAGGGGGLAYASGDAVPGEALYPVKQAVEGLKVAVAFNSESKAVAHLAIAETKLKEIEELHKRGKSESGLVIAAEQLGRHQEAALDELDSVQASGQDPAEIVARLQSNLDRQQEVLNRVLANAPEQAKDALRKARERSRRGLENAIERHGGTVPATGVDEAASSPERPVPPAQRDGGKPSNVVTPQGAGRADGQNGRPATTPAGR